MSAAGLRRGLDRTLEVALALLLGGMVLNVLWQVFARYGLGDPSGVTEELARFALVWLGLLGAGYGFGRRLHLAVDLVGGRFAGSVRAAVAVFALSVLGVGGGRLVQLTLELEQRSPALGIPLGWVYAVLPLSAAVVLLYTALDLLARARSER